jgi:hypothetical protein
MFPVKAKSVLPVEKIVIHSVSVRGDLGNLTVWVSNESIIGTGDNKKQYNFRLREKHWTKVYEKFHKPSRRRYETLDFSNNPVVLQPGQVRAIYIHSTLPGDRAIVYDNTDSNPYGGTRYWSARRSNSSSDQQNKNNARYEDNCISIHSGKAHLSEEVFGTDPIWGWGNAWRDRREFVGQIKYGTVFKLWNPNQHISFGPNFKESTLTLLGAQRRMESNFSKLPDECIYYILNMCRWDWFIDCPKEMKRQCRARERRIRDAESITNPQVTETAMAATTTSSSEQQDALKCDGKIHNMETDDDAVGSDSCDSEYAEDSADDDDDSDDDDAYIPDAETAGHLVETSHSNEWERNLENDSESPSNEVDSHMNEDDDDEEEEQDDVDEEEEQEEEEENWEAAHGYRADPNALYYVDMSSDSDDNDNETLFDGTTENQHQDEASLMRRARFHLIPSFLRSARS